MWVGPAGLITFQCICTHHGCYCCGDNQVRWHLHAVDATFITRLTFWGGRLIWLLTPLGAKCRQPASVLLGQQAAWTPASSAEKNARAKFEREHILCFEIKVLQQISLNIFEHILRCSKPYFELHFTDKSERRLQRLDLLFYYAVPCFNRALCVLGMAPNTKGGGWGWTQGVWTDTQGLLD